MKYLVLGPGGIFFYSIFGHVYRLFLDKQLDDLQEISGASAGSLVAFMWTLGKTKVFEYVFSQDLEFKVNPVNLLKHSGLVSSKRFREKLMHLCVSVFGFEDITFEEHFKQTGIILHVSTFSLLKKTNVYYSVSNSPSMSILDAITMSCAIPFYFTPFKDHIDGGFVEAIPATPFIGSEKDTYAVTMDRTYPEKYDTFSQYLYLICSIVMNNRWAHTVTTKYLTVPNDISPVSFNIPKEERFKLFSVGFSANPLCTYTLCAETENDQFSKPSEEHQTDPEYPEPQNESVDDCTERVDTSQDVSLVHHREIHWSVDTSRIERDTHTQGTAENPLEMIPDADENTCQSEDDPS